jgi:hypothetical protein
MSPFLLYFVSLELDFIRLEKPAFWPSSFPWRNCSIQGLGGSRSCRDAAMCMLGSISDPRSLSNATQTFTELCIWHSVPCQPLSSTWSLSPSLTVPVLLIAPFFTVRETEVQMEWVIWPRDTAGEIRANIWTWQVVSKNLSPTRFLLTHPQHPIGSHEEGKNTFPGAINPKRRSLLCCPEGNLVLTSSKVQVSSCPLKDQDEEPGRWGPHFPHGYLSY